MANNQSDTASIINYLLNAYMQGYDAINNNQTASLNTSKANSSTTENSSAYKGNSALDWTKAVLDSQVL